MHKRLAFFLVLLSACGGAEPANDLLGRRANQPVSENGATAANDPGASGDVNGTDPTNTTDPAATPSSDAGTGADTGASTPPPPADAFTGAPAFVAQTGPSTLKGDHPFTNGNPAKQSCLQSQCHGAGGSGPRFIAGGTVFKDIAGTMPAAQVEVRIRDANGDARIAHTDANGNFYFSASNNLVDFPARTGVRDAANTKLMAATIANGDCSSSACHGGAQGVIHVP